MNIQSKLNTYYEKIFEIDGFSNNIQVFLVDILVASLGKKIDALEIGTWEGRTTSQLAQYSKTVTFVEIDDERRKRVRENVKKYSDLTDENIFEFKDTFALFPQSFGRFFDFIHIDALHTKYAVSHDLDMATKVLNDGGLICMDDFYSYEYPQVTEAVYEFLFTHRDYCLLFAGYNKGIICKVNNYARYHNFFTVDFPAIMKTYAYDGCAVSKSTPIPDSFTFGVVQIDENTTHRGFDAPPHFGAIEHIGYEYNRNYMDTTGKANYIKEI